jgi:hypothetical protein
VEWSDVDFSEVQESEGEEEEDSKEKKKTVIEPGQPQVTNAAIVESVLGPETVKADELRRFMIDVGMCTLQQLNAKFKDRIRDPERRAAFRKLLGEHLARVDKNGTPYLKLKTRARPS